MAEAGKSISDALDKNLLYINVMNHFQAEDTVMPDIGILACTDPVALDQACVDLVYMAENSAPFINAIESQTENIFWSTQKKSVLETVLIH